MSLDEAGSSPSLILAGRRRRLSPDTVTVLMVASVGQGVGRAICKELAAEGVKVVVNDLFPERAEAVAQEIRDAGGAAVASPGDITNAETVAALVAKGREAFGPIGILVNNAGVTPDRRSKGGMPPTFIDTPDREMHQTVELNVYGTMYCCRAVLPAMHERKWGRIINITSRALFGNPGQTNYSAAKAGLVGFTRALSLEQARNGITVNAIAPGFIETEYIQSLPNYERIRENALAKNAVPFGGETRDIASAVAFMASEHARYITGTTLFVTGGRYG